MACKSNFHTTVLYFSSFRALHIYFVLGTRNNSEWNSCIVVRTENELTIMYFSAQRMHLEH
jgi:hypothetical protein